MFYRIEYTSHECEQVICKRISRLPLLTILTFFAFLILVDGQWPEGKAALLRIFSLEKVMSVVSVLNEAAEELVWGSEPVAAIRVFEDVL